MTLPLNKLRSLISGHARGRIVFAAFTLVALAMLIPGGALAATKFNFGDGLGADYVYFHQSAIFTYWLGVSSGPGTVPFFTALGGTNDQMAPADYNGDGLTDFGVRHPGGVWDINYTGGGSTTGTLNIPGSIPQSANFTGNSEAEIAVFLPATGDWYVKTLPGSTPSNVLIGPINFGLPGDKPVAEDYNGDGYADYAIYRNGVWWIKYSNDLTDHVFTWGLSTDIPVPADYDGDNKADLAVFRPSSGHWFIRQSATGTMLIRLWGTTNDVLIPADYNGDGKAEPAIYRNGDWWIDSPAGPVTILGFGTSVDVPALHAYVQQ